MDKDNCYTDDEIAAMVTRIRRDQRTIAYEECCKIVCKRCAKGDKRYVSKSGNSWHGLLKGTADTFTHSCPASDIHMILDANREFKQAEGI